MSTMLHDTRSNLDVASLEAHLRLAWQEDLRLQQRQFAAELSVATAQIMACVAFVATLMTAFLLIVLTPQRASSRLSPRPEVSDVQAEPPSAGADTQPNAVARNVAPGHSELAAPAVRPRSGELESLERRLVRWMVVLWGSGLVAVVGAALAVAKL